MLTIIILYKVAAGQACSSTCVNGGLYFTRETISLGSNFFSKHTNFRRIRNPRVGTLL